MEYPSIRTPVDGINNITRFLIAREAAIPADIRAHFLAIIEARNDIQGSVTAVELIYARRNELPEQLIEMGAQIAAMISTYNFNGMRVNGRGPAIAAILSGGEVAEAPEPASEFAPPAPESDPAR